MPDPVEATQTEEQQTETVEEVDGQTESKGEKEEGVDAPAETPAEEAPSS